MLMKKQQSVCGDLLDSLEKPEFCNIKIVSSDGEIPASKEILSIRSEYFCRMFSQDNNFVESSTGQCKLPYPKAVVKKVVLYLYSGEMDVDELDLGQLLDLMELLNLMNLTEEFNLVESYSVGEIEKCQFPFSDCLKNLDKCSKMRMETLGETLITHLGKYHLYWFQQEEIGVLSETMMMRLLQESKDSCLSPIIWRFRTFVTWLSANSLDADKKEKVLETFDFKLFTAAQLASDVRASRLYSSDKIITRMDQLCRENEEEIVSLEVQLKDKDEEICQLEFKLEDEIGYMKEELNDKDCEIDHLEEELREEETILEFELSVKDQKIYQLTKEKNLLEKALNNKRKNEDQASKGKIRKFNFK